jgi:hypothetical protein
MSDTVSLEVAIEVVLRNGPNFELIAGLCKMAAEAEREACANVIDDLSLALPRRADLTALQCAAAIRARGDKE